MVIYCAMLSSCFALWFVEAAEGGKGRQGEDKRSLLTYIGGIEGYSPLSPDKGLVRKSLVPVPRLGLFVESNSGIALDSVSDYSTYRQWNSVNSGSLSLPILGPIILIK